MAFPAWLFAQDAAAPAASGSTDDTNLVKWLIILAAAIIIIAVLALFKTLNAMLKVQEMNALRELGMEEAAQKLAAERHIPWWRRMLERWTDAVPIEQEKDVLFEHEYDGIQELDNKLPPWWLALFYITIAFAVVYIFYYHISGMGMSSHEMYAQEMKQAEAAVANYKATHAAALDESSVTLAKDDATLSIGETVYKTNCVSCHGGQGEGGIGPNLTDAYWLHGGGIQNVFKTISNGVPEKGMLSWKSQLKPEQIQAVASYILVKLQGTNPPNAKEPQGELYADEADQATDESGADETNGTPAVDETALSIGEVIYKTNCIPCHGNQGEGTIGPNLTDKYWIHGGSLQDVLKVINEGVPEKGMLAWKDQLKPDQIEAVANYILVKLQGTNPPNAKEPQGDLYEPEN